MNDRPAVKKSSPSPIARSVESGAEVRPLSPIKRVAVPLAVAAALALAGGGGIAYAVAGSSEGSSRGEKHATRDSDAERPRRTDDSVEARDTKRPEPGSGTRSFVDDVFTTVGDFFTPDDRDPKVDPPKPIPTTPPTFIPPNPNPPPMAGAIAMPNTARPITPPTPTTVKTPIPPATHPPAMPGGMRPPAPVATNPTRI